MIVEEGGTRGKVPKCNLGMSAAPAIQIVNEAVQAYNTRIKITMIHSVYLWHANSSKYLILRHVLPIFWGLHSPKQTVRP